MCHQSYMKMIYGGGNISIGNSNPDYEISNGRPEIHSDMKVKIFA